MITVDNVELVPITTCSLSLLTIYIQFYGLAPVAYKLCLGLITPQIKCCQELFPVIIPLHKS